MKYVGETGQKIRDRFEQHMKGIRLWQQQLLHKHFREVHNPSHMKITIVEMAKYNEENYRRAREAQWITKLNTLHPTGLNSKTDPRQPYLRTPALSN